MLKTRIKDKDGDPDYWEPARPQKAYGMDLMSGVPDNIEGRSKTRWNSLSKNVELVDFRQTLGAFDRFFYHTEWGSEKTRKEKKDIVRQSAPHLKMAIEIGKQNYSYRKERIVNGENLTLTEEQVKIIGDVLGRQYKSIKLINHRFFERRGYRNSGYTAQIQFEDLSYSEAFAGSGEFATIVLIKKLTDAPEKSLLLLDEPEVSLFPGAQSRLMDFLFDIAIDKKHQIVIATHSQSIISLLPNNAIKILALNNQSNRVNVISQSSSASEAFVSIGERINKKTIIVEDKLACEIIKRSLRAIKPTLLNTVEIQFVPGGFSALLGYYAKLFSEIKENKVLIFLDGDQRKTWKKSREIPESDNVKLKDYVKNLTGVSVQFITNGNDSDLITRLRNYIDWCCNYLKYLPGDSNPENFIIRKLSLSNPNDSDKDYFEIEARKFRSLADSEIVTSNDIFEYQKHLLTKLKDDDSDLKMIVDEINNFVSKEA